MASKKIKTLKITIEYVQVYEINEVMKKVRQGLRAGVESYKGVKNGTKFGYRLGFDTDESQMRFDYIIGQNFVVYPTKMHSEN